MARTIQIVSIAQSGGVGVPGKVRIAGNFVSSFSGKFYRQLVAPYGTLPFYSQSSTPAGYALIPATTFDIISNGSYAGRYTVYTPQTASEVSSSFNGLNTEIIVNEVVGPPTTVGDDGAIGLVTNMSTYLISIEGEAPLVVAPLSIISGRPLDIIGRNGSPWAESFTQNFMRLAQNFAGPSAPVSPYLGMMWYDDSSNALNLRTTSGWITIASGAQGSNTTYRWTQPSASTTWTINHGLGLIAPYVAMIQVFVDTGGGAYKMILPSDISFDSANSMTITFSQPQIGVALVRA